jgi:hypothetical protein
MKHLAVTWCSHDYVKQYQYVSDELCYAPILSM